MKIKFITLCFLFLNFMCSVFSQDVITSDKGINSKHYNTRFVWNPIVIPVLTPKFLNNQFAKDDQPIQIEHDRGILFGARLEKYYPNNNIDYAVEIGFEDRFLGVLSDRRFLLRNKSIEIVPIISLKKGNFDNTRHPFIEFGIKNKFLLPNSSYIKFLNENNGLTESSNQILKNYRISGYIGIGIKNDIFNHTGSNPRTVGLQNFSIGLDFPIFNQGNIFKNRKALFLDPFDLFEKNYASSWFFRITYSDLIDVKKNKSPNAYSIPIKKEKLSVKDFFPPMADAQKNSTNFFGNFFLHATYQPQVDSVFFSAENFVEELSSIQATTSFKLGYTLHFGNYKQFIADDTGQVVSYAFQEKKIQFDGYFSCSIFDNWYELRGIHSGKINQLELEILAGLRVGLFQQRFFLTSGYSYFLPIVKKVYLSDRIIDLDNFSRRSPKSIYIGLNYKRLFSFKIYYRKLETLAIEGSSKMENLTFSFGLGI